MDSLHKIKLTVWIERFRKINVFLSNYNDTLVVKGFEQQKGVGSSKTIIGLLSCLILEMEIASINHNFLSIEGNNHMTTKYLDTLYNEFSFILRLASIFRIDALEEKEDFFVMEINYIIRGLDYFINTYRF